MITGVADSPSLALGIGANTAIFSLIDTVMLRLLPVQKPEELVQVRRPNFSGGGEGTPSFTNPLWELIRDNQDVFSGAFAWGENRFDLAQGGAVQNASGIFASGDYFNTLGVRPVAGRHFPGLTTYAAVSPAVLQATASGKITGARRRVASEDDLSQQPSVPDYRRSLSGFYGTQVGSKFDVAIPICTADVSMGKSLRLDQRLVVANYHGARKPGISKDQLKARLGVLSPQILPGPHRRTGTRRGRRRLKLTLVANPAAQHVGALARAAAEYPDGCRGTGVADRMRQYRELDAGRAAARHRQKPQ